uniref:Arf-GAP domain-containing protein n=1 Tax=Timema monikensis TaxID=170555 RepID=A0A7R9EHG0_9NEOP|nr:unnamed protein product [Timema monikensis]
MAEQGPSKNDIQILFKRLRSISCNKVCFDCNAKNPTWATVTYGVFICIDCSAVHRSLGVHLTFVRSTQLDTNWTWLQLRQMQLGGNANAMAFFRQHNCTSTDAQQKYNSRAAQLYKEKLHQMAVQAMKIHGTKLHLETSVEPVKPAEEKEEVDFFAKHTTQEPQSGDQFEDSFENLDINNLNQPRNTYAVNAGSSLGPNVDSTLNNSAGDATEDRKPTIGGRKPIPKRSGMGAKKGGLGAHKVKTNFADIEREATMADQLKVQAAEEAKMAAERSAEEQHKHMASMRLAYQDLGLQQKKEEEKMKRVDPKKAQQYERLGMGFASRTGFSTSGHVITQKTAAMKERTLNVIDASKFYGNTPACVPNHERAHCLWKKCKKGMSHSALSDMKSIEQETPNKMNNSKSVFDRDDSFFDDYHFTTSTGLGLYKNNSTEKSLEAMFLDGNTSRDRYASSKGWVTVEPEREQPPSSSSSFSGFSSIDERPSPRREATPLGPTTDEAQKKFGSAKAISSQQFFGDSTDNTWERKANLSRFEGSSSISSADYFGTGTSSGGGGITSNLHTPDFDDMRESVRQGVTKVAGKLSSMANGVMSSIQEVALTVAGRVSYCSAARCLPFRLELFRHGVEGRL